MKDLYVILNQRNSSLEAGIRRRIPDVRFLYSNIVYDRNYQSLRIRKHEDGELYLFGRRLKDGDMDYIDCHEYYLGIPAGRYLYMVKRAEIHRKIDLENAAVVVMPQMNEWESHLAMAMFLKKIGCDESKRIHCLKLDPTKVVAEDLAGFVNGDIQLPYFETVFSDLFRMAKEHGFASTFPISRDIRYLQAESRMTNYEFAEFFGVSVRNVENWRQYPDSLKAYIYDLFEYKLLKEGII